MGLEGAFERLVGLKCVLHALGIELVERETVED